MLMGNWIWQDKITAYWAVVFLPLISLSPVMDFTYPGIFFRYLGLLILTFLFISVVLEGKCSTSLEEDLFAWYMILIGAISIISGLYAGNMFNLDSIIKFYVLNFLIYIVAKSFISIKEIKHFFNLYYWICLIASTQAVLAMIAEYVGIRDLWQIPISDGRQDYRYYLSWGGFLGGDVGNGRTNFYFSEATHFAHFLFPSIAYALGLKRWLGLIVLLAGFASTFSGAASFALLAFIIIWSFSYATLKDKFLLFALSGIGCLVLYLYVNLDPDFYRVMFDRKTSILDKLTTYHFLYFSILIEPFGRSIFETSSYFAGVINTSPGLFNLGIWFGIWALPPISVVLWALYKSSFLEVSDALFKTMCLGLFFLTVATFSHGPTPKYFMVFFYGCLMRYREMLLESK